MNTKSQHNQRLQVFCLLVSLMVLVFTSSAQAQATFTGVQLRGTVQDSSKAAVPRATVIATHDGTEVSEKITTDEQGRYLFNTLQPASYTVRVEAAGFKTVIRPNVVLRVGQQADLDFTLEIGEITSTIEVTAAAPLLNSVSAALGQEVDNRYVTEVPLFNRVMLNLAFLAPGVTEVQNGNPFGDTGINFTSNGQRNSSSEVRVDGSIIGAAEGGEGGMFRVHYQPTPDAIQEFKVQNNGLSAEFGNNGGTVINAVTRSGTNEFHGTGYWFGRRPQLDAGNFFDNRAGNPKPDFKRDQYGGTIGGPIFKQKTFFFFDYDRTRFEAPATLTATMPTAEQKRGDFSHTFNPDGSLQLIFNPFDTYKDADGNVKRRPFPGNVIPPALLDPVAVNLMSYFPGPTGSGDPITGLNNFTRNGTSSNPAYQDDIKVDHNFSEKSRIYGRFSHGFLGGNTPRFYGNDADDVAVDDNRINNVALEHLYTFNSTTIWTNRFALDRFIERRATPDFDPTTLGFPSQLREGGKDLFPRIDVENFASLGPNFCQDVVEAHTLPHYASSLSKVYSAHNLKFGGEQRILLTNFYQPCTPGGYFTFHRTFTAEQVFSPSNLQGNALASLLLGWPSGDRLSIQPATATKSKETAFYVQDDWRITPRLTLNLGLRYEWSTPYTERYNRSQIADFDADTGVDVPGLGRLRGVNLFTDSNRRSVDPDRNNFGPRIGTAYRINQNTVVRAGFGVYYGVNPATNSWLTGSAFRGDSPIIGSLDGGVTRYASLSNPFPSGLLYPQGRKYGKLNLWGLGADSHFDSVFRNAEVYQWNLSLQRELPGSILVEAAYSGSHSVHLPFQFSQNRNFIPTRLRESLGAQALDEQVPNPFAPLFTGPNAIFNEPNSIYNLPTISRIHLLRPFPQFDGTFSGFPKPVGSASYNAVQLRFEKRYSHGLHFLGSYTFSKMIDDSTGFNAWLTGGFSGWGVQDQENLRLERSVSPAHTPHRLVFSWGYEVPVGRGKALGRNMNRAVDAVVGGWQINGFTTFQSGLPLNLGLANPVLHDGSQRPDLIGDPRGASIQDSVDGRGIRFNPAAFATPEPEHDGTAPRYTGLVRGDGIHNLNLSIFKSFQFRERMKLQLRGEFFNFTNTPRFSDPDTAFGSTSFGVINSQSNSPRQVQMAVRFLF
jgi:Carboxypeptidase regulatory-like domain/TonB dependent receptor